MSQAAQQNKTVRAIHPGEILLKEFLEPLGLTRYRLAKDIHVTLPRINDIVHGKRSISADTGLPPAILDEFASGLRFALGTREQGPEEDQTAGGSLSRT
jgi:addiction module HigA family antidote